MLYTHPLHGKRQHLQMKIDKSLYTKEEYKRLKGEKQQRKIAKAHARKIKLDPESNKINILCLKHGTKYDSSYVNKLYTACKKHCTLDFKFYCATEDPQNLHPQINVIKLPNSAMSGWWYKPWLFSRDLQLTGTILYMDLDVVVADNINKKLQIAIVIKLVNWEKCSLALFFNTRVSIQLILDNLVLFITKSLLKLSLNN